MRISQPTAFSPSGEKAKADIERDQEEDGADKQFVAEDRDIIVPQDHRVDAMGHDNGKIDGKSDSQNDHDISDQFSVFHD